MDKCPECGCKHGCVCDYDVPSSEPPVRVQRSVMRTATAWDSIGWDEGLFRIKGGRTTYEAVMYNCHNEGSMVKLAKLVTGERGVREVKRYVSPDTVLEFLSPQ